MNSVTSRVILDDSEQKMSSIRQPALQQPFCYMQAFALFCFLFFVRGVFGSVASPQSFTSVGLMRVAIVRTCKCLSAYA
jgi:hypothetical protein